MERMQGRDSANDNNRNYTNEEKRFIPIPSTKVNSVGKRTKPEYKNCRTIGCVVFRQIRIEVFP